MQIECGKNELDLLKKSFEISNPDYNGDIGFILEKFDKWTDFTYKVKLRLNKRSKSDQIPRTNNYVSVEGGGITQQNQGSFKERKTDGTFCFLHFLIIGKNVKFLQYIIENQPKETSKDQLFKEILVNDPSVNDPSTEMVVDQDKWILGANCIHLAAKFMPMGLNLISTIISTNLLSTGTRFGLKPLHIAARNDNSLSTR